MGSGGGGDSNKAAEEARRREQRRQAKINDGMTRINNNFSGFNDDFYSSRRQEYLDYVQPDFQDQYDKAREALIFSLARGPGTASTVGAKKMNELRDLYEKNQTQINRRGDQIVNNLRTDVANSRANLVSSLNATADPYATAASARERAALLSAPGVYDPLPDLFEGIAELGAQAVNKKTNYRGGAGLFQDSGSGGSQTVVD